MKNEYELSKIDIRILDELRMNEPIGLKVKLLEKFLGLQKRNIYRRLEKLEKIGLVINNYPLWKLNSDNLKNIRSIKGGKNLYLDSEKKELIKLNKDKCYFCGYNKILDEHHIIPKNKGGFDKKSNILILCPNCHTFIHRNNYSLLKMGRIWKIVDSQGNTIMLPYEK